MKCNNINKTKAFVRKINMWPAIFITLLKQCTTLYNIFIPLLKCFGHWKLYKLLFTTSATPYFCLLRLLNSGSWPSEFVWIYLFLTTRMQQNVKTEWKHVKNVWNVMWKQQKMWMWKTWMWNVNVKIWKQQKTKHLA